MYHRIKSTEIQFKAELDLLNGKLESEKLHNDSLIRQLNNCEVELSFKSDKIKVKYNY